MARHLFIVSRHHPRLYDYLVERFQDDRNVQVIVDRRAPGQRPREEPTRSDAKSEDRRKRVVDDDLNMRSHVIITLND
jgi:hypothetical protein